MPRSIGDDVTVGPLGGHPWRHGRGSRAGGHGRSAVERRPRRSTIASIAAGTLLTEGTRIPPRSLVMGRPGKVKRTLTDEEVAEIRWYADTYVNYRLDYSIESEVSQFAD